MIFPMQIGLLELDFLHLPARFALAGKDALELYGNCKRAGVCQMPGYGEDLTVSSCC